MPKKRQLLSYSDLLPPGEPRDREAVVNICATSTQHIFAKRQEGSSALFTTYTAGTQDTQKEVIVKVTGECANAGDTVRGYLLSIMPQ